MTPVGNFALAAGCFADLVGRIPDGGWSRSALGGWDLRTLVGHTSRALITVTTYVQRPAPRVGAESPEQYFALLRQSSGKTDPVGIDDRAKQAGLALGEDPLFTVRALVAAALAAIDGSPGDPVIETIAGGMHVSRYLPTRTFELVVHSLDIAAALDLPFDIPESALSEAAGLAASIAVLLGDGRVVLMSLTGRRALPEKYSIV